MQDIILFGVQWSGKGTQCRKLLSHYGEQLVYFESWTILRALKSNDNAIGNYVKSIIDQWIYLPDEFLIWLVDLFLQVLKPQQAMLLDGFPRRLGQMHMYLNRIRTLDRSVIGIYLELDKDIAIDRLSHRRVCPLCSTSGIVYSQDQHVQCTKCNVAMIQRVDDTPHAIAARINQYEQETQPVLDYYREHNMLVTVNANQSEDKVFENIIQAIGSYRS